MLVKFLKPIRVYLDGIHPFTAEKGQTHDLPLDLVEGLTRDGYVEEVKEPTKGESKKDDPKVSTASNQSELAGTETKEVKDDKQKSK